MDAYESYILGLSDEEVEWEGALDDELFWQHYLERKESV